MSVPMLLMLLAVCVLSGLEQQGNYHAAYCRVCLVFAAIDLLASEEVQLMPSMKKSTNPQAAMLPC